MKSRRPVNSAVMRLIIVIAITVLLGLCLLQSNNSFAQPKPYGVFRGRIVDTNGNVVRGASVAIESANYTRAVKPNPAGHFGIELPVGVYKITVTKSGFATYQLTNVDIRSGGYASHVFQLERPNRQSALRIVRWFAAGDA